MSDRQKFSESRMASRRSVLQTAGAALAIGAGGVGTAAAQNGNGGNRGFPPNGITNWGPSRTLGNGEVSTFTVETPSGELKHHGLYFDRETLSGLPTSADLATNDKYDDLYGEHGEGAVIHGKNSQQFFIPLPESDNSPFTLVTLNWNPNGHPLEGVWTVPHFDMHFHTVEADYVESIQGPRAPEYELPSRYVPEGFIRGPVPEERIITYMGEHLADAQAPEIQNGQSAFDNTYIWGVADPDDDGVAETTFFEPMITREYLQNTSGQDTRDIPQPEAYKRSANYPTEYTVRDVPSANGFAVTLDEFEFVEGDAE